jgi:hypothetical protein
MPSSTGRSGCAEGTSSAGSPSGAARVDELFEGERAELAKTHALRVARAFHDRLDQMPTPGDAPAAPGGLTVTQHG